MIFFMGGGGGGGGGGQILNIFGASRISLKFLALRAKTWISKKIRFAHQNWKKIT